MVNSKIILFLIYTYNLNIVIENPEYLKNNKTFNNFEYSVSLFGNLLYNKDYKVILLVPPEDNIYGCKYLNNTYAYNNEISDYDFAWLLKRGNCTYSQKANNVMSSGAILSFVYLENNYKEINYIPIGVKGYKNNILPPVILINNLNGESFLNYYNNITLESDNYLNLNKTLIFNVNLDLKITKKKVVDLEFSLNPSVFYGYNVLLSLKKDILGFGNSMNFEPKYRFKNLEYSLDYMFNQQYFVSKFCILNGQYCLDDYSNFKSTKHINIRLYR